MDIMELFESFDPDRTPTPEELEKAMREIEEAKAESRVKNEVNSTYLWKYLLYERSSGKTASILVDGNGACQISKGDGEEPWTEIPVSRVISFLETWSVTRCIDPVCPIECDKPLGMEKRTEWEKEAHSRYVWKYMIYKGSRSAILSVDGNCHCEIFLHDDGNVDGSWTEITREEALKYLDEWELQECVGPSCPVYSVSV